MRAGRYDRICNPIGSLEKQHGPCQRQAADKVQGEAGKATAKRQADWTNLKVDWPQPKQAISLRIDQDILAWFRDRGPGYQTRMNAVLRAFVDVAAGQALIGPRGAGDIVALHRHAMVRHQCKGVRHVQHNDGCQTFLRGL